MCFIVLKFYIEETCLVFLYLCSFLGFKHTLLGQIRATCVFFFPAWEISSLGAVGDNSPCMWIGATAPGTKGGRSLDFQKHFAFRQEDIWKPKLAVLEQLMIIFLACELMQQPQAPEVRGGFIFQNILLLAKKIFENPKIGFKIADAEWRSPWLEYLGKTHPSWHELSISKLVSAFLLELYLSSPPSPLCPLPASYLLVHLQMNLDKISGDIFCPTPTTAPRPVVPSLLIHSDALEQKRRLGRWQCCVSKMSTVSLQQPSAWAFVAH